MMQTQIVSSFFKKFINDTFNIENIDLSFLRLILQNCNEKNDKKFSYQFLRSNKKSNNILYQAENLAKLH